MSGAWRDTVQLSELNRGAVRLHLEADEPYRRGLSKRLDLPEIISLVADVEVRAWLDGAEIEGHFRAQVRQICGITLEPFEQPLEGRFEIRVAPAGSPHAIEETEAGGEITLDLEAPDPPDILQGDAIDVGGYLAEAIALEVDPFPRKPGATFDYEPPPAEDSPFAVLKKLERPKE